MKGAIHLIIIPYPLLLFIVSIFPSVTQAKQEPSLHWNIETWLYQDDNVYRVINRLAESDTAYAIKPELIWLTTYDKHQFDLNYHGEYSLYFNETELNYNDHNIRAHARLDHTSMLDTEYTLGYDWRHDHPGEKDKQYKPDEEPNKWQKHYTKAKIYYGRYDTQSQIVGHLSYAEKHYTNNDRNNLDTNQLETTGFFYYRTTSKSRILYSVTKSDTNYVHDSKREQYYQYLAGVTWDDLARTSGNFKFGYRIKKYENAQKNNRSGLAISLKTNWRPSHKTLVSLAIDSKEFMETVQQDTNGIMRMYINAGVIYTAIPTIKLITKASYDKYTFINGTSDRVDGRRNLLLGVEYSLLPWLNLGAEYSYEERDSTNDDFDFSATMFMLSISAKSDN
jgi:hypothetical protein